MTNTSFLRRAARSSLPDGSAVFEKSRFWRYSVSCLRTAGFARGAMVRGRYADLRRVRLADLVLVRDGLRSLAAAVGVVARTDPRFLP